MTPQPTGLRAAAKPTSPATKALRERWRTKQSQQSLHQLGGTTIGHAVGVEQLVQAESIDQSGQQRECVVGVDIGADVAVSAGLFDEFAQHPLEFGRLPALHVEQFRIIQCSFPEAHLDASSSRR